MTEQRDPIARYLAPTEEEIRAAFGRAWRYADGACGWSDGWSMASGIATEPYDLEEMRPSELERLDELVGEAVRPIREAAGRQLIDAVVGAVLTFAREHPEAPRRRTVAAS